MNKEKLDKIIYHIADYVENNNLREALELLSKLVEPSISGDFRYKYNHLHENYHLILKYFAQGVKDPERPVLVKRLKKNILSLADELKHNLYSKSAEIPSLQFQESYTIFLEFNLDALKKQLSRLESLAQDSPERTKLLNSFFFRFWLENHYGDTEKTILNKIIGSQNLLWYEKSLIVSAVTLSLLQNFDVAKFFILIDFIDFGEEKIWERALVGIVFALNRYDKRISIYADLDARLRSWENPKVASSIEKVALQIIRTQETEKISRKLQDEVLPEISKIGPKIVENLDLDNILGDDFTEDGNPDWENIFSDVPDLMDTMGELSMMQMEGSDVFMSTFSALKNFDFFHEIPNWFLPFYRHNIEIKKAFEFIDKEKFGDSFLDALEAIPIMCNSDKYSFCFNLSNIPPQQMHMMGNLMMAEFEQINELNETEKLSKTEEQVRYVFTRYIQDLYRFFKLSPNRNSFTDLFTDELKLYDKHFFRMLTDGKESLYHIAQFYFEKQDFVKAAEVFEQLIAQGESSLEIYQKTGFAYQKQRNFKEALSFYLKAELFDHENEWTSRKIGFCYLKLKKPKKALKYYSLLQDIDPDNLNIQAQLGRCYLEMKKYEEALIHFYKVEYLDPKNIKVWRPIAWCSLALGKLEKAEKYLTKIIDKAPNKHDYMNLGHVFLISGKIKEAIEYYHKSINQFDNDYVAFLEEMEYDFKILKKQGVDKYKIKLIEDFLYFEEGENE